MLQPDRQREVAQPNAWTQLDRRGALTVAQSAQSLATGAAGFIGSNPARRVQTNGTVRVLNNLSPGHETNPEGLGV